MGLVTSSCGNLEFPTPASLACRVTKVSGTHGLSRLWLPNRANVLHGRRAGASRIALASDVFCRTRCCSRRDDGSWLCVGQGCHLTWRSKAADFSVQGALCTKHGRVGHLGCRVDSGVEHGSTFLLSRRRICWLCAALTSFSSGGSEQKHLFCRRLRQMERMWLF